MKNVEELMSVFGKLKKLNPNISLGGSVAAHLQGAGYRDEAKDLDIVLNKGAMSIALPEGARVLLPLDPKYPANHLIYRVIVDGVKVDILKEIEGATTAKGYHAQCEFFTMSSVDSIVSAKLEYIRSFKTSESAKDKHSKDIVKMMSKVMYY